MSLGLSGVPGVLGVSITGLSSDSIHMGKSDQLCCGNVCRRASPSWQAQESAETGRTPLYMWELVSVLRDCQESRQSLSPSPLGDEPPHLQGLKETGAAGK